MAVPGYSAGSSIPTVVAGQTRALRLMGLGSDVVPQTYPAQCQGAQGFTNTTCYGVVLACQDCCKLWNWQQSQYVDVCGSSYVCGACFGLPW
jgi:hypothetical protein